MGKPVSRAGRASEPVRSCRACAAGSLLGPAAMNAETESVIDGRIDSALAKARAALSVLPRLSERLVRDLAIEARAVWDGFSHFCRTELGLPPEAVLRAHFATLLDRLDRQVSRPARHDECQGLSARQAFATSAG
jgi:hypothetical protein